MSVNFNRDQGVNKYISYSFVSCWFSLYLSELNNHSRRTIFENPPRN